MPCTRMRGRNGEVIFVCSRGPSPRKKCVKCGRPADLLCDWPAPRKKSGTCDAPLCERCTFRPEKVQRPPLAGEPIDDTYDLCPKHAEAYKAADK